MVNRSRISAFVRLFVLLLVVCATFSVPQCLVAQQPGLPPAEPPQSMPQQQQAAGQIRVTTNVVVVPTLVEKDHGQVIYGLKSGDFTLEDNGTPQKLRVEEEMDSAPV